MERTPEREPVPAGGGGGPVGVLMVNLGSPASPETREVRRFLREFLSDPMVVDLNRLVWRPLLELVILPLRAPKSAALYRKVWTEEGSPLVAIGRRQREALAGELGEGFRVALGMRYGEPAIAAAVGELVAAGCGEIVLFPMFPQASATTTGTVEKEVRRVLGGIAPRPALRVVPPYFADPAYVAALAARVRASEGGGVDHHVFSFHGLPVRYVEAGDPYRDHCEATAAALAAELGLGAADWSLVYQSRFGREPWLEPDAAELVPRLAERAKRVLIACPAFTADCLETLEEIAIRLRAAFLAAGGEELVVVPCLNDDPAWIAAMAGLVRGTAAGA